MELALHAESASRSRRFSPRRALVIASIVGLCACEGSIGAGPAGPRGSRPPGTDATCTTVDLGTGALRRLTPDEYTRTVRDLLSDPTLGASLGDPTGDVITLLEVDELTTAADALAAAASSDVRLPCATGATEDACAASFVETFGRRAFRRPVRAEEREWLIGVYDRARAELGFEDAMSVVLQVMLQAPQLLYFEESGVADPALPDGVRRLDGYERASRLSYFLWGTTPDPALLDAAEDGALDDADGVRAQAARMLDDDRARAQVVRFFTDWLELDGTTLHRSLEENPKNETRFPDDSPALRAAMRREVEALVERVFFEGDASLETLLTTRQAYVNGPLAALYGVSGGPEPTDEETFAWVELDPSERAGLFTRAAFLSLYSGADVQSPIRRGVFVLERVVQCSALGDPPPNASDVPVVGGAVDGRILSVREDVHARTVGAGGTCAGCHSLINPIGYLFERYDALGAYQLEELHLDEMGREVRVPIDSSGEVPESDIDGSIGDAVELAERLGTSRQVTDCMTSRWVETAIGRRLTAADRCSLRAAQDAFAETDDMRELLLGIVTSDSFLYFRREEG